MAVEVQHIEGTVRGERVVASSNGYRRSPLDIWGGPPIEWAAHLTEARARSVCALFLMECQTSCGRRRRVGRDYIEQTPLVWRCLRDLRESEVVELVVRVQRSADDFRLPGDGLSCHRRIEALLERLETAR